VICLTDCQNAINVAGVLSAVDMVGLEMTLGTIRSVARDAEKDSC